ncbi:unnamed protein product [Arctogadus glacialis]
MAEAGGPESAARSLEESSDSDPEQEHGSPQKLIRKVSTSAGYATGSWQVRREAGRETSAFPIPVTRVGSLVSRDGQVRSGRW